MNDGYIWKGEETIRCTRLEETVDCPEEWRGEEEVRSQQSVKNKKCKKRGRNNKSKVKWRRGGEPPLVKISKWFVSFPCSNTDCGTLNVSLGIYCGEWFLNFQATQMFQKNWKVLASKKKITSRKYQISAISQST